MKSSLYDLCEMLEDELKEIVKKGDISPNELERVYRAVDIMKDIKTIEAMEEGQYSNAGGGSNMGGSNAGGGSNRGGSYRGGSYEGSYDGSYEGGGSNARGGGRSGEYSEEGSYRRGRDARGRYTSRDDGYSREEDKEQMLKHIEQMKKKIEQM